MDKVKESHEILTGQKNTNCEYPLPKILRMHAKQYIAERNFVNHINAIQSHGYIGPECSSMR